MVSSCLISPYTIIPIGCKNSVRLNQPARPEQFEINPGIEEGEAEVRVFVLSEHGFVRTLETRKFPVHHGKLVLETAGQYNLVAVIERHSGKGRTSLGLIDGFGMKKGAMASTIGHDSHNITIIGTKPWTWQPAQMPWSRLEVVTSPLQTVK